MTTKGHVAKGECYWVTSQCTQRIQKSTTADCFEEVNCGAPLSTLNGLDFSLAVPEGEADLLPRYSLILLMRSLQSAQHKFCWEKDLIVLLVLKKIILKKLHRFYFEA